jgi:hypothetical protein
MCREWAFADLDCPTRVRVVEHVVSGKVAIVVLCVYWPAVLIHHNTVVFYKLVNILRIEILRVIADALVFVILQLSDKIKYLLLLCALCSCRNLVQG